MSSAVSSSASRTFERHLVHQCPCGVRIVVDQPGQASHIDRQRDEVLLNAIVEGALDRAPVCVRGLDEPLPRQTDLRYFGPQSIDFVLQRLGRTIVRDIAAGRPRHGTGPALLVRRAKM